MGSDPKGTGRGFYTETRDGLDSYKPVQPGFEQKSLTGTNWPGGTSEVSQLLANLSGDSTISKPYQQSLWWYASVSAIAEAVRQAPLRAMVPDGEDDTKEVSESDPVRKLFESPNPLFSGAKFWELLAINHKQDGETIVVMLKSDAGTKRPVKANTDGTFEMPDELWPVRGALCTPVIDPDTKIPVEWKIKLGSGVPKTYPVSAILHIATANPYSPYRGQGAMTAALRDLAKSYGVDRFDEALLANGGAPGGVLTSEQSMTPNQLQVAREAWGEANGRPEQDRKTAVLPNGMTYQQFGFSPKDMEFGDMREWMREGVLAVTGTTKPLLGLTEGLNFASSVEARKIFWSTTIKSVLRFFEDELAFKFTSRVKGAVEGLRLTFDLSAVPELRADEEDKARLAMELMTQAGMSFAEACALARWDHGVEIENPDQRFAPTPGVAPDPNGGEDTPTDGSKADTEARGVSNPASVSSTDATTEIVEKASDSENDPHPERTRVAKAHDKALAPHEDRLEKKMKRHFRDYILATRKRVREIAASEKSVDGMVTKLIVTESELTRLIALNEAAFDAAIWSDAQPIYEATIEDFAKTAQAQVAGEAEALVAADPEVIKFLNGKKILVKEGWKSTLAKDLRKSMISTLATAPSNIGTLSAAIAETLTELEAGFTEELDRTGMRARRIARTEINGAANFASSEQWRRDGVTHITWITSRDGQVRNGQDGKPNHVRLDGKTIQIGDTFGHGLHYPGDNNAPAGETVNCRCTTIPEIPDN